MRQIHTQQCQLGQTPIEKMQFDIHSRDDIPQILRGLQYLYSDPVTQKIIFAHLEKLIPADVDANNGRPGMDLWNVFVLATLRVNLNCDVDRIVELANEHRSLRMMLGHDGPFVLNVRYCRETVRENLYLVTEEVLDDINVAIVNAGHQLLGKSDVPLLARCDSFVVETDIEYPTDIRLLNDAMRKVILACGQASKQFGVPNWRNHKDNHASVNHLYIRAQRIKHSSSKDQVKKTAQQDKIIQAHQAFIDRAGYFLRRAQDTLNQLANLPGSETLCAKINYYGFWAYHQIDLIRRRVMDDEKIPHAEKIFSLFKPYSEWISKGKAGVSQELGLRVCIVEDQFGFLLHHQVMEQQTDDKIAVSIVRETKARFPNLRLCSFDKGFWSTSNQKELAEILDQAMLPKKGGLSKEDRERQSDPEFIQARKQHAAVESAINALEVHGLDFCPDYGLDRFKRYVALAIVARNTQKLGAILLQRERDAETRRIRLAA